MIRQVFRSTYLVIFLLLTFFAWPAYGQEEGDPAETAEGAQQEASDNKESDAEREGEGEDVASASAIYLPIKPAFVVNYGGKGRLKYIKSELSVRLDNTEAASSVRHHLPLIRNNLVMLFSSQTDQSIGSQDGQEALRQDILREIQTVVLEEDGIGGVKDVFFTTFFVQR